MNSSPEMASNPVDPMNVVELDIDDDSVRASYDGDRDPASLAVVAAVAAVTDRDPAELTPLHFAIDTDALDELFSPTNGVQYHGSASFRFEGVDVTVSSEESIRVSSQDRPCARS